MNPIDFIRTIAELEESISDIHLACGCQPVIRSSGVLKRVGHRRLGQSEVEALIDAILPSETAREGFREGKIYEYDFSFGIQGFARFRVNVYHQRNTPAIAMRKIQATIPSFDELGLPPVLGKIAQTPRGLVIVTGITGCGKSSTLASMVDYVNQTQEKHVITIEDPIEFLHQDGRSVIRQREVGCDTGSFASALKSALRQDPDLILVGEMRDPETMEIALQAAETGHLVLSTLHTQSAAGTINRIVDSFPPHQHHQVRMQLADTLEAIICQRLLIRAGGVGRIPAVEIMIGTRRVREAIRNVEKTDVLLQAIENDNDLYGMQSFDQHVKQLFVDGSIDLDTALTASSQPADLILSLQSDGYPLPTKYLNLGHLEMNSSSPQPEAEEEPKEEEDVGGFLFDV